MMTNATAKDIVDYLGNFRFYIGDEKMVQVQIYVALLKQWISTEIKKEFRLDKNNIIDFLFDGRIGIEVKIKGSSKNIYYQCERYCNFEQVSELILITNKPMTLPAEINGKKTTIFNLSNSWL